MTTKEHRTKHGDKTYIYHNYVCTTRKSNINRTCTMKNPLRDRVDSAVWAWVVEFLNKPDIESYFERYQQNQADNPLLEEVNQIEQQLETIQKRLKQYIDDLDYLEGASRAAIYQRINESDSLIAELNNRKAAIMAQLEQTGNTKAAIQKAKDFAMVVRAMLGNKELTFEIKREIINTLGLVVVVLVDYQLKITIKFSDDCSIVAG